MKSLKKGLIMFREGTYLVRDNKSGINYLVCIKGTAPYLKVMSAINFSKFQECGEIVSYKQNSTILKAIEKDPDKFEFNTLAIELKPFFSKVNEEEPQFKSTNKEETSKLVEYYLNHGCDEGSLTAHIAVSEGISVPNATEIAKSVIKSVKQREIC